ncbi:MAG: DNA polymerase IV [Ruminococcus sp.]|nr:DNA polymerase IV [Ruminococcus sp.]
MKRDILHVDCNNFFASVESVYSPELRDIPFAVAGRKEERHGIILAKNELAKAYGVRTGEAVWEAKQKCPMLTTVEPHFDRYHKFSRLFKGICFEYTDLLESFGIDECWLDLTGNRRNPVEIAEEIRRRVKEEYGLTVSIGVSFNKIFAKLGSDMKKPDAVTVITEENFKEKIWKLPVENMLGVGRATMKKLKSRYIETIGELAETELSVLESWLGKWGEYLWIYANGLDSSPVMRFDAKTPPKSVSSGVTPYRDLENDRDVKILIYALSENIAMQLREHNLKCRTVSINIRDRNLSWITRQCSFSSSIADSSQLAETAFRLYKNACRSIIPVRSISVCASELVPYSEEVQLDFGGEAMQDQKKESINRAVDNLRKRFGYDTVRRAVVMQDKRLGMFNPKETGETAPVGFRPNI